MKKDTTKARLRDRLVLLIWDYGEAEGTDFACAFRDVLIDMRHLADEYGLDYAERDKAAYQGYRHPEESSLQTMLAVTDELHIRGYEASLEYPGFIHVERYGLTFDFANNNETWDGDVDAERSGGVVHTDVPSDATDVQRIADAVAAAIESCKPEEEN